jgi:hypothetical protein
MIRNQETGLVEPAKVVNGQPVVQTSSQAQQIEQDTSFTPFSINAQVGWKNVPAGYNNRLYGGQEPVIGEEWVISGDTPAVWEPGNYDFEPAISKSGASLGGIGGYDPKRGVFVIARKDTKGKAGQSGQLHELIDTNINDFDATFSGGQSFEKIESMKKKTSPNNNIVDTLADSILGKKANAASADGSGDYSVNFTYGPNSNVIKTPNLTDLDVPVVSDNGAPSVGVGSMRKGNPIDVGKDPLAFFGVSVMPRSSPLREILAPDTYEPSSLQKYNKKVLEIGVKDSYWQTQEGKTLKQEANSEQAWSFIGVGGVAPSGLGKGVSLTKDIIPKIPIIKNVADDVAKGSKPVIDKAIKPITIIDDKLQSGYEKGKTAVIETWDTLPQKYGEKIGVDLTDTTVKPKTSGEAPFNMQTDTIPGITRTPESDVYKPSGIKSSFKKGETEGYLISRETVVSTPQTSSVTVGTMTAPGLYNPVKVDHVWVSKKAYEQSIKAGGEISRATPMSYEMYTKTIKPIKETNYDLSSTTWSFTNGPLKGGRPVKPYVPYSYEADVDPAKYMFMKGGLRTRKNVGNVLETDAVSPPWVNNRPTSPHIKSKPSHEKAQNVEDDITKIMTGDKVTAKTSTSKKVKTNWQTVNTEEYILKSGTTTGNLVVGAFKTPTIGKDVLKNTVKIDYNIKSKPGVTPKVTAIPDDITDYVPDYIPDPAVTPKPKTTVSPVVIPTPKTITTTRIISSGGIPIVPFNLGSGGFGKPLKTGRKKKALWENDIEEFNPFKTKRNGVKKVKSNRKIKSRKGRR